MKRSNSRQHLVLLRAMIKIAVCSVSHRLGSFGSFYNLVKTVIRPSCFGTFVKSTSANPHIHRLGSFGRTSEFADVLLRKAPKVHRDTSSENLAIIADPQTDPIQEFPNESTQ
jgi:hypothetical protein